MRPMRLLTTRVGKLPTLSRQAGPALQFPPRSLDEQRTVT
jgi:hypothetical protein